MADAFLPVGDRGFASEHGQHITLRTNRGTGRAANAVRRVDVGMQAFGIFGVLSSLLSDLERQILILLQVLEVAPHKENCDGDRHGDGNENVHAVSPILRGSPATSPPQYAKAPAQ